MGKSMLVGLATLTLLVSLAGEGAAAQASMGASGERTITLIHLNDLHANLVPHLDMVRVVPGDGGAATARVEMRGGVARIATLVKRIRRDNPQSLLMNVGDTYHDGVEALYTRGNAIVPALSRVAGPTLPGGADEVVRTHRP